MSAPYVQKLFTGKVKKIGNPAASNRMDQQWESGIFKTKVQEPLWLSKTGLTGDEVADTKNHGGPEKAIFAYPIIHYAFWKEEVGIKDIEIGGMGENLAVHFMDEHSVCIGDTYQFCDSVIQVSQPRQPCWKPARRFRKLDFALSIQKIGKTGWYFRVLKEGVVQGDRELELLERPYPQWTIAACNEIMHDKNAERKLTEALYSCEYLAESWKQTLSKRLAGEKPSIDKRVYGPNKV